MPSFTARFTAGTTVATWDDHQGGGVSRINPVPGRPQRYHRATVGVPITIKATVNGVEGRPDSELGGFLFSTDFVEYPDAVAPVTTSTPPFSSIQTFTPTMVGHYFLVLFRTNGGAVGLHFDVES